MRELLHSVLPGLVPWALSGSPRDQWLYVLSLSALLLGTALCLVALRVPRCDAVAVGTAGGGVASWLLSSGPAEGRTLLEVLPGNGLTVSDLLVLPAVALVLALCWRRLRER